MREAQGSGLTAAAKPEILLSGKTTAFLRRGAIKNAVFIGSVEALWPGRMFFWVRPGLPEEWVGPSRTGTSAPHRGEASPMASSAHRLAGASLDPECEPAHGWTEGGSVKLNLRGDETSALGQRLARHLQRQFSTLLGRSELTAEVSPPSISPSLDLKSAHRSCANTLVFLAWESRSLCPVSCRRLCPFQEFHTLSAHEDLSPILLTLVVLTSSALFWSLCPSGDWPSMGLTGFLVRQSLRAKAWEAKPRPEGAKP